MSEQMMNDVAGALKHLAAIKMPDDFKTFRDVYLQDYFAAKGALSQALESQFSHQELQELYKVLNQMLCDDYDPDDSSWPPLLFKV